MSSGIAIVGLLLSSPAVVIGAMLISPLMGPIIGPGFGIATFDGRETDHRGSPEAVKFEWMAPDQGAAAASGQRWTLVADRQ